MFNREAIERVKREFPKGTKICVDYISDGSYPDAVGHYGWVKHVDDAGQVHCTMEDGSHATVCRQYGDSFFRV